jgi:hypothetical protein
MLTVLFINILLDCSVLRLILRYYTNISKAFKTHPLQCVLTVQFWTSPTEYHTKWNLCIVGGHLKHKCCPLNELLSFLYKLTVRL